MKYGIEYGLVLVASALLRLLPRRARLSCGRALGSLVFFLDRRHQAITFENVQAAFGDQKTDPEKRAIARGAFRHFAAMLIELITLGRPSWAELERTIEVEGVERFEKARARGKGVILVAAHFGNWELHAIAHGYLLGRIFLVARSQDNRYLNDWLERVRGISGNEVVYKHRALRQMVKLMKTGETVAFVSDQNVHLDDAVFVDFFGRKAATTRVPSWFALKTGAALVPVFCYPLSNGGYRAIYEEPLDSARFAGLEHEAALMAMTQELASIQERYVRERPDIWLWMHRRWRTRPPEEAKASSSGEAKNEDLGEPAALSEAR
jgi:KDO2-lipid IV(A) lauroyltransferase